MKTLLEEKAYNKRRSFHPRTSTLERQQMVIFRNVRFCSSIDSSQTKILWRKEYTSKTVLRSFITDFGRKIYSDNLRPLHRKFYATQTENVSFSVFYT